jgi:hypothetical protein
MTDSIFSISLVPNMASINISSLEFPVCNVDRRLCMSVANPILIRSKSSSHMKYIHPVFIPHSPLSFRARMAAECGPLTQALFSTA